MQRDVAPNVAVEVDQNRVHTGQGLEKFSDVIVWLNLDGVRIEGDAQ